MNLIVVIDPDPIRISELDDVDDKHPKTGCNIHNNRFVCTCYQDVVKWCVDNRGANRVWRGMGAHWYCIRMGTNEDNLMKWEMPRGVFELEDRLWKAIEVYAAFYDDIP